MTSGNESIWQITCLETQENLKHAKWQMTREKTKRTHQNSLHAQFEQRLTLWKRKMNKRINMIIKLDELMELEHGNREIHQWSHEPTRMIVCLCSSRVYCETQRGKSFRIMEMMDGDGNAAPCSKIE